MPQEDSEKKTNVEVVSSDKPKSPRNMTPVYMAIVAIVFLAVGFFARGAITGGIISVSQDEVGAKVVDFLQSRLSIGYPGIKVELAGVSDFENMSGVYEVDAKITYNSQSQTVPYYATKDGNYILSGIADLNEQLITSDTGAAATKIPKSDKPEYHMFVMSFCPYGQQAMTLTAPVDKLLDGKIDFSPNYVIYDSYCGYGRDPSTCSQGDFDSYCMDKEHKYCSMHSNQEVNEDIRQICIWNDQKDKYWDYVLEISSKCSYTNVDSCWEGVAKSVGVDVNAVKSCQSAQGAQLLDKEKAAMNEFGARGSETLIVNGNKLNMADYRWSSEKLKNLICSAFNNQPSECGQALSVAGSEGSAPSSGGCGA